MFKDTYDAYKAINEPDIGKSATNNKIAHKKVITRADD